MYSLSIEFKACLKFLFTKGSYIKNLIQTVEYNEFIFGIIIIIIIYVLSLITFL